MSKNQKSNPLQPPARSPLAERFKRAQEEGKAPHQSRPVENPGGAQRQLADEIGRIEQEMIDETFSRIRGRLENLPDMGALKTQLKAVFERVTSEKKLLRIMTTLDNEQRQQLRRQISTLGLDPIIAEPWLRESLDRAAEEAIRRIWTRVEERLIPRVVELARQGIEEGKSTRAIARQIAEEAPGSSRNPALLARDLVGSQLGELHKKRQEALGIKAYIWRTSRDERVVGNPAGRYPGKGTAAHGDHFHREGKIFLWKKEGDHLIEYKENQEIVTEFTDGHPGQPPLCRCWPQPYIPELADLQSTAPGRVANKVKYR